MHNKTLNPEYRGKIYIPHLDIELDAILIPNEYILYGLQELEIEEEKHCGIMHGEFDDLGKVTILDCFYVMYVTNRGRFSQGIQFIKIFSGVHLTDHADEFISAVTFYSSTLDDWICKDIQVLQNRLCADNSNHFSLINVKTKGLKIRVDCKINPESSIGNTLPAVEIKMQFLKPLGVSDFYVLRCKLQKLILFLTNENPNLQLLNYNGSGLVGIRPFEYFDRDWFTDAVEFSFVEINNELLEDIFQHWFENHKLDNVRDLLLEKKHNPDLSKGRYFLNMCIALESFHRRFINDDVPLVDHSAIENRERIKGYLEEDTELLKWFKTKSAFWNSPTLYDRLIDLKDEYKIIVGDLFQLPIEDLIRNVKKCRDRLAHDGEYEMIFKDEVELFLVGYSLEMLLYILLYKYHGVKEDLLVLGMHTQAHGNLKHLCVINRFKGVD